MPEPARARGVPERLAPTPASEPAILIGANEDHRRMLRGLLLMHHQSIALEASSLEEVPQLPADAKARTLVFVAPRDDARWADDLRGTLVARPELHALVLLPLDKASVRSSAARAGARAILSQPFTSREFLEALDSLGADAPRPRRCASARRPSGTRKLREG